MKRFKLLLLAVLLALSFATVKIPAASAQGLPEFKILFFCTTDLAPDGSCYGDIMAIWNLPDDAVIEEGCQDTVIQDNTLLEPLYCRYTSEGETFTLQVDSIPWELMIPTVNFNELLADEIDSLTEIPDGVAESLKIKLYIANRHIEEKRFLVTAELYAAFVYEGTAWVKGDGNPDFLPPDFLPWDLLLDISDSLKAVGIVTPSE